MNQINEEWIEKELIFFCSQVIFCIYLDLSSKKDKKDNNKKMNKDKIILQFLVFYLDQIKDSILSYLNFFF